MGARPFFHLLSMSTLCHSNAGRVIKVPHDVKFKKMLSNWAAWSETSLISTDKLRMSTTACLHGKNSNIHNHNVGQ